MSNSLEKDWEKGLSCPHQKKKKKMTDFLEEGSVGLPARALSHCMPIVRVILIYSKIKSYQNHAHGNFSFLSLREKVR